MTSKVSFRKRLPMNVTSISTIFPKYYLYEFDYLDELSQLEREISEKAPHLSFSFSSKNVTEEKKVIIEYVMHLGIQWYYSSNVIY